IDVAAPTSVECTSVSRVIERVEEFGAELRFQTFRAKCLGHAEINILRRSLSQLGDARWHVSQSEVRWLSECVGIDPIRWCLVRWLWTSYQIGEPHPGKTEIPERIVSIERRQQRQTAGQADNARHLPVSQNLTNHFRRPAAPRFAATVGQFVDEGCCEAVRDIVHADSVVEL